MGEPATVRVADVLRAALDVLSDEDYARLAARIDAMASIAPTKPPREMPAPEWTGPDMYQTWSARHDYRPEASGDAVCPAGFVAIGPWEPCGIAFKEGAALHRDWRRPLRRVQG